MSLFWRLTIASALTIVGLAVVPASVGAATMFLNPGTVTVAVGEMITVGVKIDTAGQAINDGQATVVFPPDLLEFKEINLTDSVFTHWTIKPAGSNTSGEVVFAGGLPTPGYSGQAGTILTITWQAKNTGQADITVTKGHVLANNGQGTDVLSSVGSGTYSIIAAGDGGDLDIPTISSPTYPDQNRWYQPRQALLNWTLPAGLIAVSYVLDQAVGTVPDDSVEKSSAGSVTLTLPSDGIWYFHLRGQYKTGWSQAAHFRLRFDQTPPEPFTLELIRDRSESDPTPQIVFRTVDAVSGIDHHTISLDDQPAAPTVSPAVVAITHTGQHRMTVLAYDRAGNVRQSQVEFSSIGYPPPTIDSFSSPLILLQSLIVNGQSAAGDTVTIYIDGEQSGQVRAGQIQLASSDQVHVRLPWSWRGDYIIRPGNHQLTATATGPDGQTSVQTDPVAFTVSGTTLTFGGRPLATVAILPALGAVLLALSISIIFVMTKLGLSVVRLHRQEEKVETEVADLEQHIVRGDISAVDIQQDLKVIANDLHKSRSRKENGPKRRTKNG